MGFSRQGLVDLAHSFGLEDANLRLVTSWAKPGIIGNYTVLPRRIGGGSGSRKEWSDEQALVWLVALMWHKRRTSIAELCNLPVSMWLYQDEGFLSIPHVRQAMRTWLFRHEHKIREERNLADARWITRTICPRNTPGRIRFALRDEIECVLTSQGLDFERLTRFLRHVLRDSNSGSWGPIDTPPETIALAVATKSIALRQYEELTDTDFERARLRHRTALPQYLSEHADLAVSDEFDGMFKKGDSAALIKQACSDVCTLLGMELFARERGLCPDEGDPSFAKGVLEPFGSSIRQLTLLIDRAQISRSNST